VICRSDGKPPSQFKVYQFPRGFLWGASTSSHQVEGGNCWNDWWEYEQSGRLPYKSGEACRHYERFEQDFDLARDWGHNAHRFSVEWSRIEPSEGNWNLEALAHYSEVIRALRHRGLEPVVTLHHFTNPVWFSRRGGWLRRDSARLFARYAGHTVRHLGAEVKYWLTVNEPTDYVMQGYINGEWPPFFKSAWVKAAIVFRNLARAHTAAYRELHRSCPDVNVGFAHNASPVFPCNPGSRSDRLAARLRDLMWNRAFFHLIGARPRHSRHTARTLDFIGLNYYKRTIVHSSGCGLGAVLGRTCQLSHHHDQGPISATGWEVYPPGLRAVLEDFSRFGLPLLVTENGIATDDESLRREFLISHLQNLAEALQTGVDVIGYLYWSLIDNFEWALGTKPRFGLAGVDYNTQQRLPRPFVEDFSGVCRENQIPLSLAAKGEGEDSSSSA
jgi:beta-glucosidase